MTLKQFKKAIAIGNGLPFVRIRGKFPTHFSPAIFRAAIDNLAYDPQCEGSRDYYAFQLLTHSVDWERLIRQFFDHFRKQKDPDDYHNIDQLFRLAYRFHVSGFPQAREIIFDRYDYFNHPDIAETFGQRTMIRLGLPGIERYARATGRLLRLDKTHPSYEKYRKRDLKKYAPKGYKKHLRRLARTDENIAAYLAQVIDDKTPSYPKTSRRRGPAYDYIKQRIANNCPVMLMPRHVEELNKAQIEEFADDLISEIDPTKIRHHLKLFGYVPFPLDIRYLYQLLRIEDARTQSVLARALGRVKVAEIRRLAIARLSRGKEPRSAIEMLGVNYQPKDEALMIKTLKSTQDQHAVHGIGFASEHIRKLVPEVDLSDFSLAFIRRSRCAICRCDHLKYLLAHGCLPEELRLALAFDCNDEIRALATQPVR